LLDAARNGSSNMLKSFFILFAQHVRWRAADDWRRYGSGSGLMQCVLL
jgi:hypothetical protein